MIKVTTKTIRNIGLCRSFTHTMQQKRTQYGVAGIALAILFTATACSNSLGDGDPDEGGIIGTGIMLRGAVSTSVVAANNAVEVKSSDGQLTELVIDSNNQFNASSLAGTGPWVMRVSANADLTVYGVVHGDGTSNLNRFSDLGLRAWFARQSRDLDSEFNSSEPFTQLPTDAEYAESTSDVFQLIEPVLASYDVSGEDTISANYAIDDQGVDAFLNRNTVLIENGLVSFLLTDPVTNTLSTTRSALHIGNEFLDNGASAPTVPGSVRALASASDEIVLVWEPSADDVAVLEYQVVRDGALIATTPYPVYIDSQIPVVQAYSYEVIAVDVAGNSSLASTPVVASPLLMNDVVPPPAPSLLVDLSTTGSTVQLLWAQDEIGDVVSFNLYRGANSQALELLLRVTSTVATDTTVQENQSYCYQVTSVDGSGNESSRSEVLCVTASQSGTSNSSETVPLVEWNVPNIDSLDCEQSLSSAQIQQGVNVISAGCYRVLETLEIGAGATLTLTEGVVLKFGEAAKLLIPVDATLTINGTPEIPVVLTGEFTIPGYWGGIEFQGSRSAGNLIRGAVVQYAGGADTAAAINITTQASRFRMEDTLVRFNRNMAINFKFIGVVIDRFQGNRITENDSVGFVSIDIMQSMVGNSEYIGNVDNVFSVSSRGYTNVQLTIPNLGIPLSWNGVQINRGSLTIEPGVEFRMVPVAIVDIDGSFIAEGTAEQPILMLGRLANAGSWRGLRLSGRGDKTIKHMNMTYAGDELEDTGAIEVVCTLESAANFSIDHVDITDSASWGIFVKGDGCSTEVGENLTFFNNALGGINVP